MKDNKTIPQVVTVPKFQNGSHKATISDLFCSSQNHSNVKILFDARKICLQWY